MKRDQRERFGSLLRTELRQPQPRKQAATRRLKTQEADSPLEPLEACGPTDT